MKEILEILLFGLFGLWIILIPMIMIMKIRYFKKLRHKQFNGISDLFAFWTPELWIAGITFAFPILGKGKELELKRIKKNANRRLMGFYGIILIQLIIVVFLNSI